jgi:hypothetical protein
MKEIFKKISNTYYEISNLGTVISYRPGGYKPRILKPDIDAAGYYRMHITLNRINKFILLHRLVAKAFIKNPKNKPHVNHKNGNKSDNSAKNLEWCTVSENHKHAFKIGLRTHKGEASPSTELTNRRVKLIKAIIRDCNFSNTELSILFDISTTIIKNIRNERNWNNIKLNGYIPKKYIKTHCINGHEYNKTNTRIYMNKRICRVCDNLRYKKQQY